MDLQDLTFIDDPPSPPPKVKEDESCCHECLVEGSQALPSGVCDTCGAPWLMEIVEAEAVVEEADDFTTALDLLDQCSRVMENLLKNRKIVNKMGVKTETAVRDLLISVEDFTEDFVDVNEFFGEDDVVDKIAEYMEETKQRIN